MTQPITTPADVTPIAINVTAPSAAALERGSAAALELVEAFEVVDAGSYELAAEELVAIQKREKALVDQRLAITRPMDAAKSSVMDLFRAPVETLGQAAAILKRKMVAYTTEQQRKANEERIAAERAAQQERDRLEAEARALKAEGRAGEAAVKEQVAAMVIATPPAAPVEVPKVAGVSTRSTVDFEVTSLLELVQHVAAHPELLPLLAVDSVKLRAQVRALGMATKLPGVKVFEKTSLAASRK